MNEIHHTQVSHPDGGSRLTIEEAINLDSLREAIYHGKSLSPEQQQLHDNLMAKLGTGTVPNEDATVGSQQDYPASHQRLA